MLGKSVNVLLRVSEKKNIGRYIGISDFKTNKHLYRIGLQNPLSVVL